MLLRFPVSFLVLFGSIYSSVFSQEKFTVLKDLREDWMVFDEGSYQALEEMPFSSLRTIYLQLEPQQYQGASLHIRSTEPYYIFVNGQVRGEFAATTMLNLDSLFQGFSRPVWVAIHQDKINERDLETRIISRGQPSLRDVTPTAPRPYSSFRDFVVIAGLVVILLFLVAARLNPKLAADYLSVSRIFTSRDIDDSQSSARLAGGSNIQFYVLCSLLIGFYLFIVLHHLPPQYALPGDFDSSGFWMMWAQWLKLCVIIFLVLVAKLLIIFLLTRLFNMRGMARFHFFNWIRLLLVVIGGATVILFIYFISHRSPSEYYVVFLWLVVAVLSGWIAMAFSKLGGKTGHSLFHLFSYLCATEIIPLLLTVKVLFQ